jgi:hypothetical protein
MKLGLLMPAGLFRAHNGHNNKEEEITLVLLMKMGRSPFMMECYGRDNSMPRRFKYAHYHMTELFAIQTKVMTK